MLQYDIKRAAALANLFTAQELESIMDAMNEAPLQGKLAHRMDAIISEAFCQAVDKADQIGQE